MTNDILARAEQAMEGVTEGPWEYPEAILGCPSAAIFTGGDEGSAEVLIGLARPAEGRFIAAARTLVPELVTALREARATNARLNRRCQLADHALATQAAGRSAGSLGRGLANWAATKYREERDEARAAIARVRALSDRWGGVSPSSGGLTSGEAHTWNLASIHINRALDAES